MRDLFVEDGPDTSRAPHLSPDAAQEIRDAIAGRHVCPFCGSVREQEDGPCPRCSMDNTSSSRQATKARIGPWYVFQSRNPAAPGMKFETLLSFVRKGRVKARSVVRGPTTHQLWRFAAHVKGLSREFGICYSCGGSIDRAASLCQHCNRSQEPPTDPDVFIEGQQSAVAVEAASSKSRNAGPTPLAADDIVVPPLSPQQAGNRADAKREDVEEDEDTKLKRAEGFLSPQDLAAAFNLDFRPKGRHARAQQQQRQSTEIARRPAPPKAKRPARWGRRIFMLLILGGIGAGVYAFQTKPQFHDQVIHYSKQGMEWGKAKWAELNKPSPKTPHTSTPDTSTPVTEINVEPAPIIPATQPAEPKRTAESKTAKEETSIPTEPPVKSPEATPTSKPDAWEQIYGKPAQKSKPRKVDTSTAPQTSAPKPTGTIDDVRKLYREAIDAEGNGDYAVAVKKYEQIKEFSRDLWPRDLDLRLTQARRQAQ